MSEISVIIPVKNRKSLLEVTIKNLLRQTLTLHEVIVVDDHSTDGTPEYIKERFEQDNVSVITSLGNGPGAARNTGIQQATGAYIQFFDSDDLMTKNKLAVQATILDNNPDVDIVYGPYVMASENEFGDWEQKDVVMQYYALPNRPLHHLVAEGWCSITQACLFRRSLIDEIGPWRTDLMPHEDKEYWYRLGKYSSGWYHENESCIIYRQHQKQITDQDTKAIARTEDGIKALNIILKQASEDNLPWKSKAVLKGLIVNYTRFKEKQLGENSSLQAKDEFFGYVQRIVYKIGRMCTKTDWQPMYGCNNSEREFENYLNNLN